MFLSFLDEVFHLDVRVFSMQPAYVVVLSIHEDLSLCVTGVLISPGVH